MEVLSLRRDYMSKKIVNFDDLKGKELPKGWSVSDLIIIKRKSTSIGATDILFTKKNEVAAIRESFPFEQVKNVFGRDIMPFNACAIVRRDGFGFYLDRGYSLNHSKLKIITMSFFKKIKKKRRLVKWCPA